MHSKLCVMVLGAAVSALGVWPAFAEVPTAADFAACNMKAAEGAASDTASASPPTAAEKRAGELPPDARPAPAAPSPKDPTGSTLSSDKDPQVEGLDAARAGDRAYVAAYRSCMRQRGF